MTDQEARYDRIAAGYERWWAPVIAPTALTLLDVVEPLLRTGRERILDLGTGTGTLARAAVVRWPGVTVHGIDASGEMVALAAGIAERELSAAQRGRLSLATAFADSLPLDDASVDLVMSSFVLQLVPNRMRALRESRRVLRAGGRLAYVTWLRTDRPFVPDLVVDELLEGMGIGGREPDGRCGDPASVAAAAAQLRKAGFQGVTARPGMLEHTFDPDGYLSFLTQFDEEDLFEDLGPRQRRRLEADLLERLRALSPDDLILRLPVVTVVGTRRD
jgi:SAM-dependent methyltransferase